MADEVSVVLSAVNNISGPVEAATASLVKHKVILDSMGNVVSSTASGSEAAARATGNLGAAAERAAGSHRSAHRALSLVSGGLVELAGGSAAAESSVRVLDSVMFTMATTGGAVSFGLLAVVAAAAAAGFALKSSAEETKKQREELDRMTDSAVKAVSNLSLLDSAQKATAGVGGAMLLTRLQQLRDMQRDLNAQMKENTEAARAGQSATIGGAASATANALTGGLIGKDTSAQANEANIKIAQQLQGVAGEIRKVQAEYEKLHRLQGTYVEDPTQKVTRETQSALRTMGNEAERSANSIEAIGRALGNAKAELPQIEALAKKMGVSTVEAASAMSARYNDAFTGMVGVATNAFQNIGIAAANAAMGMANAWTVAISSIIQSIMRMAIEWISKHIVMAQAAALAHEVSTKGIIGLVTGLASIGAIAAIGATLMASVSKSPVSAASIGGTGGGGAGSTSTGGGAGGMAVSSAQSSVTNHIVVNMPVSAMDLSSVSDIQLKNLANRVGRLLAEASGQGQFSLVGA